MSSPVLGNITGDAAEVIHRAEPAPVHLDLVPVGVASDNGSLEVALPQDQAQQFAPMVVAAAVAQAAPAQTKGYTALHRAAEEGDVAAVKELLARGADVNCKDEEGVIEMGLGDLKIKVGFTPLLYASAGGHAAVARVLLDHDADADAADSEGYTPLIVASVLGFGAVVEMLLGAGADVAYANELGETALHFAASRDRDQIAAVLLAHGAVINHRGKARYHTALHVAVFRANPSVAKVLAYAEGVDLDCKDIKGETPLHWTALRDQAGIARMLIEAGADPMHLDYAGYPPLHHAAKEDSYGVVAVLASTAGVQVDFKDKRGYTALRHSVEGKRTKVVEVLLKNGATDYP